MRLGDELHRQIQAFLAEEIDADDLEAWLDDNVQRIHDSRNPILRAAADRAYALLTELADGYRTEESTRERLWALLPTLRQWHVLGAGLGEMSTGAGSAEARVRIGSTGFLPAVPSLPVGLLMPDQPITSAFPGSAPRVP